MRLLKYGSSLTVLCPHVSFPLHLWGFNGERHKASKHLLWVFRRQAPHRAAHTPCISFSLTFRALTGSVLLTAQLLSNVFKLVYVGCLAALFPFI